MIVPMRLGDRIKNTLLGMDHLDGEITTPFELKRKLYSIGLIQMEESEILENDLLVKERKKNIYFTAYNIIAGQEPTLEKLEDFLTDPNRYSLYDKSLADELSLKKLSAIVMLEKRAMIVNQQMIVNSLNKESLDRINAILEAPQNMPQLGYGIPLELPSDYGISAKADQQYKEQFYQEEFSHLFAPLELIKEKIRYYNQLK